MRCGGGSRDLVIALSLDNIDDIPLYGEERLADFGRTLVVAPHPDDESLGCGGAIALLRAMGFPVHVLFLTDGTLSHPRSRRYPAPALQTLREEEALAALAGLGVAASSMTFLRLKDRAAPHPGMSGFRAAAARCRHMMEAFLPATVLLPWRRDPHPDHRAAYSLVLDATRGLSPSPRLVEYPIWLWELGTVEDAPNDGEVRAWRLDIKRTLRAKQEAIVAHRSQTTDLIDDDPDGFRLTPEILAHFMYPWEVYLEEST